MTDYPFLNPRRPGQRRLLALDGGGIRGLLTLGILEKLEEDLRAAHGPGFRLCDYFDFIGGTSTGAILAAGLAIGKSVEELIAFYLDAGAQMFEPNALIRRAWSKYSSDPLEAKLKSVFDEDVSLGSDKLKTLLLVVMRNVTTDSPWPVTNNPYAKYNGRARADCNLNLPLWQLVRASTAAPTYFPPEVVRIGPREFVFVDGGVTPYNIPAFVMYRNAVLPPFELGWEKGRAQDDAHLDWHRLDPSARTDRAKSLSFGVRGRYGDRRRTDERYGIRSGHQLPHSRPLPLRPCARSGGLGPRSRRAARSGSRPGISLRALRP
jgi:uncharacterized protein